ncbi:MAG: HD domain-containing protein [Gemmatimonadaceae bacterium]|nr:HD domain-containing protein [Gemmatimonadaceae bacterium]
MLHVRDPLWGSIAVDDTAARLLDTPAVQRLRQVRQLGLAHLVYPGATHSRFEHALGAYHLARRALAKLREAGALAAVPPDEPAVIAAAALLHDVGHYPFSHALEEIGAPLHETLAEQIVTSGAVADILQADIGADAPRRISDLIQGRSASPLQGLISGSFDLDKIDYLQRDARMCGVPYGEIDEDRLLQSMLVLRDPATGTSSIGILEKGLSAVETLLFAKYQMYRNVYWHHACRSATAMYKRIVERAVARGAVSMASLGSFTDEGLLNALEFGGGDPMLARLRTRRLFKRAFEAPAAALPDADLEWIADDRTRTAAAERRIAARLGLPADEVLLDYPAKTQMLGLDVLVARKDRTVRRLTQAGLAGAIDLPRLAGELYASARCLRVFTGTRTTLDRDALLSSLEP